MNTGSEITMKDTNGIRQSVISAFNLGVAAREERHFANTQAAAGYFYDFIYSNLALHHLESTGDELVRANAEYLSSIALLGYIYPHLRCSDKEFREMFIELIEGNFMKSRNVEEFDVLSDETTERNFVTTVNMTILSGFDKH